MIEAAEPVPEYIPDIGDVVWIDFDPQKGNEIQKRRPALVISPQVYNRTAMNLAFICPITSTKKGSPFEVVVPEGLEVEGVILADQAKSMDWRERKAVFICEVPEETVRRVLRRVEALLKILASFELDEILGYLLRRFGLEEIQESLREILRN